MKYKTKLTIQALLIITVFALGAIPTQAADTGNAQLREAFDVAITAIMAPIVSRPQTTTNANAGASKLTNT